MTIPPVPPRRHTRPAGAPDVTSQGYRLGMAVRELMRLAPELHAGIAHRLGMASTDVLALDHVASSSEPLGVVELGNRLGIASSSATVLADRLAARGHMLRRRHDTDRRRVVLEATDSARAEVWAALGPLIVDVARTADRLDPDAAEQVLEFLTEVCGLMRGYIASTHASSGASTGGEGDADDRHR